MALMETKPALRSLAIVGANALARMSAACFFACPLLILAPMPRVIRPKRVSILTTVVKCHLPPRAVGIRLRFNSSTRARRERKPAAISSRMVVARARARESAARLSANAPCPPRLRGEIPLTRSITPSWPDPRRAQLGCGSVLRLWSGPWAEKRLPRRFLLATIRPRLPSPWPKS